MVVQPTSRGWTVNEVSQYNPPHQPLHNEGYRKFEVTQVNRILLSAVGVRPGVHRATGGFLSPTWYFLSIVWHF